MSPETMNDIFHFIEKPYNFQNPSILQRKREKTVYYGSESLCSLATRSLVYTKNEVFH